MDEAIAQPVVQPGELGLLPNRSMPIKKKEAIRLLDDDLDSVEENGTTEVVSNEAKARNDLIAFLSTKKVENKCADGYQVHVRAIKKSLHGMATTYTAPDGSILASKNDVLQSIMESEKRAAKRKSGGSSSGTQLRIETSERVRQESLEHCIMPRDVDGITVYDFGKSKSSVSITVVHMFSSLFDFPVYCSYFFLSFVILFLFTIYSRKKPRILYSRPDVPSWIPMRAKLHWNVALQGDH